MNVQRHHATSEKDFATFAFLPENTRIFTTSRGYVYVVPTMNHLAANPKTASLVLGFVVIKDNHFLGVYYTFAGAFSVLLAGTDLEGAGR